jgi:anti-anti-sigma factor
MSTEVVEIQFISVPVDIWRRAAAHQEAVQREFDILRGSLPAEAAPNRLKALTDDLDVRFARAGDPITARLEEAARKGDMSIDITAQLPPGVGSAALQLGEMMAEVDEYCRKGESLLTMATPPDLVLFREWFLGEVHRQVDQGLPPMPWPEYAHANGTNQDSSTPAPSESPTKEGTIEFEGELDLVTASELQNLILKKKTAGNGSLTVDLTRVSFIDSVGLSLLVTAHTRLTEEGGRFVVLLPERLRSLFQLSGLSDLLDLEFPPTG